MTSRTGIVALTLVVGLFLLPETNKRDIDA